ncbi:MAG: hypothetical protein IJK26_09400 [Clostridia bacterium]|nr:hypothetical protein [Clostridia bacterium]
MFLNFKDSNGNEMLVNTKAINSVSCSVCCVEADFPDIIPDDKKEEFIVATVEAIVGDRSLNAYETNAVRHAAGRLLSEAENNQTFGILYDILADSPEAENKQAADKLYDYCKRKNSSATIESKKAELKPKTVISKPALVFTLAGGKEFRKPYDTEKAMLAAFKELESTLDSVRAFTE